MFNMSNKTLGIFVWASGLRFQDTCGKQRLCELDRVQAHFMTREGDKLVLIICQHFRYPDIP